MSSFLAVYRGLSTTCTDLEKLYLKVYGRIQNNIWNSTTRHYEPCVNTPSSAAVVATLQVPAYTPDPSGWTFPVCDDSRYSQDSCGELDCVTEGGAPDVNPYYTLPSLELLLKNTITGTITAVNPCDLLSLGDGEGNTLGSEQTNCFTETAPCLLTSTLPDKCTYCYSECESGQKLVQPFKYDGILAPVYSIGLFQSYSFLPKTQDILELFICPYKVQCEDTSGTATPYVCTTDVLGTAPFCIGGTSPCSYVNLLNFGRAECEEQNDGQIITSSLYWVQVKLFIKNKYGHVCLKKPYSLHIEASSNDTLKECYTPYFATTRTCFLNRSEDDSCSGVKVCTQFAGCPSVNGYPAPQAGSSINIVFVNDCVEISQLHSAPSCNVFIVLIPNTKSLL